MQVHRTDTGQYVLLEPTTRIVVIDDDLQKGFDRIEALLAERPAPAVAPPSTQADADSMFEFRGRRNLGLMLTVGLPFVWFLFVYLALRSLERPASSEVQDEIDALQVEIASLRKDLATTGKQPPAKPKAKDNAKAGQATKPPVSDDDDDDADADAPPPVAPRPAGSGGATVPAPGPADAPSGSTAPSQPAKPGKALPN